MARGAHIGSPGCTPSAAWPSPVPTLSAAALEAPAAPTLHSGEGIHRDMRIHIHLHTVYVCTYTYYIRIHAHCVYIYTSCIHIYICNIYIIISIHIHIGTITISGGDHQTSPNAGPCICIYIYYICGFCIYVGSAHNYLHDCVIYM